jgi:hypothetical protein
MKRTKLLFAVVLQVAALLVAACGFDLNPQPEKNIFFPETQEGKNTFACYVNGELFSSNVLIYPWGHSDDIYYALYANYTRVANKLEIYCACQNDYTSNEDASYIYFRMWLTNPIENVEMVFEEVTISKHYTWQQDSYYFKGEKMGNILLTRFDTISNIVSGNFSYEVPYYNNGSGQDSTKKNPIKITQGRFDIKLTLK